MTKRLASLLVLLTLTVVAYAADKVRLVDNRNNDRVARIDSATHSIQTIDYAHHGIHAGSHYFVNGYSDLTSGQVLDFQWTMPASNKWVHWTWSIDTEDEVNWFVYEGASVTNTNNLVMTPLNSDRNSANTSITTMKYQVHPFLAAANSNTVVTSATTLKSGLTKAGNMFIGGGGETGRESELIMKSNTVYCLRAVANANGFINFDMEWYEHTNVE